MGFVKWREGRWDMARSALVSMAQSGHAVALEVCEDVERALGLAPGNRAVRRAVFEDLPSLGWAEKETMRVFRGVKLTLVRVGWDGAKQLNRLGVDWEPGEWQALIAGHRGAAFPRHTLGVLILAWQARRRGHRVKLLPRRRRAYSMTAQWLEPDLEISFFDGGRDIGFVPWEFEVRPREKAEKWKRWEKFAGGWGVCTFSAARRESLRRELLRYGCDAWVMDVESLMRWRDVGVYVPAPYTDF